MILETTCFTHSCRNNQRFQRMYHPINNQKFWMLWVWWTSWQNKWSWGTGWQEELVKKRFCRTGWSNKWFWQTYWCMKWFQKIGCGRQQSKKRSKQQSKGSYSHCQHKFYTNIIDWSTQPSQLLLDRLTCSSPPMWWSYKICWSRARWCARRQTSRMLGAVARTFFVLLGRYIAQKGTAPH